MVEPKDVIASFQKEAEIPGTDVDEPLSTPEQMSHRAKWALHSLLSLMGDRSAQELLTELKKIRDEFKSMEGNVSSPSKSKHYQLDHAIDSWNGAVGALEHAQKFV